jgi:DNA repair protein RadC
MSKVKASERPLVKYSRDAYNLLKENWDLDTLEYIKEFKLLLLNRSNSVLGITEVSKGGISGTVTDVRLIIQAGIKANASGIIVCHNLQSGNLNPIESDTRIILKIKKSGSLINIQLLEHVIINAECFSFGDNEDLFGSSCRFLAICSNFNSLILKSYAFDRPKIICEVDKTSMF